MIWIKNWPETAVLITGGTGSLGQALVAALLEHNVRKIAVFSRDEAKQQDMQARWPESDDKPMRYLIGDVRSRDRLRRALHGIDLVLHCAALKQVPVCERDPWEAIDTNIAGTRNVIEAAIDEGVKRVMVVSTDKACVSFSAHVRLANGGSTPIWKIVRDHVSTAVQTLGPSGLTSATVVGWHKNKLADRTMFRVAYRHARRCRQSIGVIVTEDHPVLTPTGWVPARRIGNGDPIITAELSPNRSHLELLVGCLLGDSSIPGGSGRGSVLFAHSRQQHEWLKLKNEALTALGALPIWSQHRAGRSMFGFALSSAAFVSELRDEFYAPRKVVPKALVARSLSPLMLAAWYMDDGCRSYENARLATHGLPWEDVAWLSDLLTSYGIDAYVYKAKVAGKSYPELRLTVPGSKRLYQLIGPYIPPTLRYKLPQWSAPFDRRLWELGPAVQYVGKAIVTELPCAPHVKRSRIPLPPANRGKEFCLRGHPLSGSNVRVIRQTGSRQCLSCVHLLYAQRPRGVRPKRDVYCLSVAGTENFVVGGIVLHNCNAATLYGSTKYVAERMAVAANAYAGVGPTRISATRYGNVVGSRGSVLHAWQQQRATGAIEITDAEATRFWITLPDAVRFVLGCCQIMQGREVFIPRLSASRIADLADAVAPDTDRRIVGLRAGEKRHEVLVSPDEVDRAWAFVAPGVVQDAGERLRGYLIWPTAGTPDPAPYILERVPPDFVYSSDNAPRIPTDKLRAMVESALASST